MKKKERQRNVIRLKQSHLSEGTDTDLMKPTSGLWERLGEGKKKVRRMQNNNEEQCETELVDPCIRD